MRMTHPDPEPEEGQIWATRASDYENRWSVVRIIEPVDPDHTDVVIEKLACWNPDYIGNVSSINKTALRSNLTDSEAWR